MVGEREHFVQQMAYTIPELLREAMDTGQRDLVRGLTAIANTMWQATNPAVRLVELIAEARKNDERFLYEVHNEVMNSVRGQEIVDDFEVWELLTRELDNDGEWRFAVPEFWDEYVIPGNVDDPDMGIESMGRLLGLCSLARHAEDRVAIGLSSYRPIVMLLLAALGGSIDRDEAERIFNRDAGGDSGRKWLDLLYADQERVAVQRLFVDTRGDNLIVNPDALRVVELIRERTNERLRELGQGP